MIETVNNNISGIYTLTPLQEGMLYHRLLDEDSNGYFEQNMTRFKGKFDPKSAILAFRLVSMKHEALRTSIVYRNVNSPYQVILRERFPEVKTYNISQMENKDQELEKIRRADMDRAFDLTNDTLLRTAWIKYSEKDYYLLLSFHHIIMDGWCMSIILGEFLSYYQELMSGASYEKIYGEFVDGRARHVDYSDYLEWLANQDNEKGLDYWEELLSKCMDVTDIPVLYPVEDDRRSEILTCNMELSPKQTALIQVAVRKLEITTNIFLETAIGILLQRLDGQKTSVFAKVVSGRNAQITGIEDVVGLFINSIPVVIDSAEDLTVAGLLRHIMEQAAQSSVYDFCSLADIQNRSSLGSNLINLVFAYENYYIHADEMQQDIDGLEIENISFAEETNYDVTILGFCSDKLHVKISYNKAKYCEQQMESFMEMLKNIILDMAANTDRKVSSVRECAVETEKMVLSNFNDTCFLYDSEKTVIDMFEEQAEKNPNHVAVVFEDNVVTYGGLYAKVKALAWRLRDLGVKSNDFVAVIAERSIEMIAGIYAIIMAGGAYVPVDPNYPKERIDFILKDCAPKAVLCYVEGQPYKTDTFIPVFDLRDTGVWDNRQDKLVKINKPEDAVYCIYTSGTTGEPKGVVNCHKGMSNLLTWLQKTYPLSSSDAVLQKTTYVFDVSVSEILWWSTAGARIVLMKPDGEKDTYAILEIIHKNHISVVDFVPSMLSEFLASLKGKKELLQKLHGLRYVIAAGEALNVEIVNEFYRLVKPEGIEAQLENLYGPTEASIYSTFYHCSENCKKVYIGKPIGNCRIYILNEDRLCGVGIPGELYIGGDGLAQGYLNRPELNKERFVTDPFYGGKMYRSGDLARWMPDGNIEYLGRMDEQVKIRGFRIELGEIESRLREQEEIKDCAVIVREDNRKEKAICAFIVSDKEFLTFELKERLKRVLPEYMIPSFLMRIDKIPITRNGKLNKRALPEIEMVSENIFVAPRNEIEKIICSIFGEILNCQEIGIRDNFFSLGGHSLRAVRLVNLIEARTGCRIAIKDIFSNTTPEQIALLVSGYKAGQFVSIPKAEEKEYYPMSSTQKRIYLLCSLDPEGTAYNMPQFMELKGEIDAGAMQTAFGDMVERHEILRTSFQVHNGEPVQQILHDINGRLEFFDDTDTSAEQLMTDFIRPFDLSRPPLLRMRLVRRKNSSLLMFDMHHIIGDGMSISIFNREFNELFKGKNLQPLMHQYKDYSEWMQKRDLSEQKNYWIEQFCDEIPVLDIPTDYLRPQKQRYNGSVIGMTIEGGLYHKIKETVKVNAVTDYMFFLAAVMVLLSKYSKQEDIVIGSPVSARTHKDTEAMLGMFTNTLALRGKPAPQKSFASFLAEIKICCLKAYENQEYPFEELVETVDFKRDFSRNPIFDVMLVLQNNEQNELSVAENEKTGIQNTTAKFDLTFNILEEEHSYIVGLEYSTDLFKKETAERLEEHCLEIIKQITENCDIALKDIKVITQTEKREILERFNAPVWEENTARTIISLLEDNVCMNGGATAIRYLDDHITYSMFNAKVNILAHKLISRGIGTGDYVAITSARSVEMIMAIFAIIKTGAAYVPIDPEYPNDRIAYILEDCKPKLVLKYKTAIETDFPLLELESYLEWEGTEENPLTEIDLEDSVYVIYTSGTTGQPKGVVNCHRGLYNIIRFLQSEYPLVGSDTILFKTTFVFDVSASEIFWWCAAGTSITVLIPGDEKNPLAILDAIEKYQISMINFVPSMFSVFLAAIAAKEENIHKIGCLKYILSAGEALKAELVNCFVRLMKNSELDILLGNLYGPTEASIYATFYNCTEICDKVFIGRPVANDQIYIMDNNQLCGIGIAGEISITGTGLAKGYLNQEELTSRKFVENPFGQGKMYLTGDLGRWMMDGNIEYIGRMDEQVKIRGYRIELGEIDNALRRQDMILDCAVIVRDNELGEKAIYAYVVSVIEVDFQKLKDGMRKLLPDYMVPSYFAQIETIPVTVNGKLDKKSLPMIDQISGADYVAPKNEMERVLCSIFKENLGARNVGMKDNFFDLGGHSLRATRVINQIEEKLKKRITIKEFFANPTPEKLARLIWKNAEDDHASIKATEKKQYYSMSPAQKRIYFVSSMDSTDTVYNMPEYRVMDVSVCAEKMKEVLQKMIDRHEILRTEFLIIEGKPVQKVLDHAAAEFVYCNDKESPLDKLLRDFVKPFDLSKAPLIRMMLVQREDGCLLLTDMHHIIGDGVSYDIFFREFDALYEGKILPELKYQYKDYSEWIKERDFSEQQVYWSSLLKDNIPVLDIPLDYVRPCDQQYDGCTITKFTGRDMGKKIKGLARKHGATEYMIFLSAAMILLSKYTRQQDIIIGSPVSGRNQKDVADMLGVFINTLVMRAQPEADKNYNRFLQEIKEYCFKAFENQEYPFEELLDSVNARRDLSRNPLFDVLLDLQVRDELDRNENTDMLYGGEMEIRSNVTSKYDITFNIIQVHDTFGISLEYCTRLFKQDNIVLMIEHYMYILDQITENEKIKIEQIETCTENELKKIRVSFNNRSNNYDKNQTIVELFERQVMATPHNTALICGDRCMTFEELNTRANAIAARLRSYGVRSGDFVVVYAQRDIEMVVAIFGVVKSGGVYVPMDPMYPAERITFMLKDCCPKVILTYKTAMETDIQKLDLEKIDYSEEVLENPEHVNTIQDPVYCIYTSGTTGIPKGVLICNSGLVNLVYAYDEHFNLSSEDVVLQYASFCFDQSIGDVFPASCRGAALYIVPEDVRMDPEALSYYMNENKVTVASLTPKLIEFLDPDNFPYLRVIDSGGEAGNLETLKKWCKSRVVLNTYGPTEATVNSTTDIITENMERITIGRPICGSKIYIIDAGGRQCGIGIQGELCISGDGLAIGYLNRPDLTKAKFTQNPFGEGRIYHTGDMARWLSDGTIEFLGRIDKQVKIRGFRIELGEVENRVRELEAVGDCAVIARKDKNGDMAIYCYIVSEQEMDLSDIRRQISAMLPDYMLPSYMMQINQIPLTRSGKVDQKALPDIKVRSKCDYALPRNEKEKILCRLFEEVLHIEKAGIKDNFFSLGGHSLNALRIINAVEEKFGQRLSLKAIFKNPTVEAIAESITDDGAKSESIPHAEKKEFYPMSSSQKRTYMICRLDEDDIVYNMPECRFLQKDIDEERLQAALQKVIDRHEIMRTTFWMVDGEPMQRVEEHADADFIYIDQTDADAEALMTDFVKPFSFEKAPMIRVMLVRREQDCVLFIDMHHIIGDGESSEIFFGELMAIYQGEELAELKCQYKDFSEWFRKRDLSEQKKYWLGQFKEQIPVLDMPTDFTRPTKQSFEGCSVTEFEEGDMVERISRFAKQNQVTDFMVYLSITMILLSKYSRQEDIIIGTPVSGRTHKDTEDMLGMFVNTLAMRGKPEANKTFEEFLYEIRDICLKGFENQDYPFEELVDSIDVQRDLSRNPIFSVLFGLQDYRMDKSEFRMDMPEIVEDKTSKFDISFQIIQMKGRLGVSIEFCTQLFHKESIVLIIGHYFSILRQIAENKNMRLSEIELFDEEENAMIENKFNKTYFDYPESKTFMELFDEQVLKTPNNIAIVFEKERLSYRQFSGKVNGLAQHLRRMGIKNNEFVAIIAERSIQMVVGIYGVIKAGGAYVPVDPNYPDERVEFIMRDCRPKAILVSKRKFTPAADFGIPVIDLAEENIYDYTDSVEHINTPEDSLYCIYTSGTTGKPKGVVNCHRGIVNLVSWIQQKYTLNEEDAVLQKTTFVFDVSVSELLWPSVVGACLVLLKPEGEKDPDAILDAVSKNNVSVIDFVPSMLAVFLGSLRDRKEKIRMLKTLKYVISAGEALNAEIVRAFYDTMQPECPDVGLTNLYGPTEASIYATCFDCTGEENKILIGKPIGNYKIYILDKERPTGIGVPGELCIAGKGLAKGYLNRPELNREKFVDSVCGQGKMYRSGDLARWLPDGNIEYLGRIDEQIKINGFRIELGEIECRIRELNEITDCAVIVREKNKNKEIYAYLISDEEIDYIAVKDRLSRILPYYMIPKYMTRLEKIPITRNGKLDKQGLPDIIKKSGNEYILPRNEMERIIHDAYRNVLNIDRVSIYDGFFELGGDSIKLIRMVNLLSEQGVKVNMRDVYTYHTVEKVATCAFLQENIGNLQVQIKMNRAMKFVKRPDEKEDNRILQLLSQYDANMDNNKTEKHEIQPRNKSFLKQKNFDICFNFDIISTYSLDELLGVLKKLIKEQTVLRTSYDRGETLFEVAEYLDHWYIPVIDADEYENLEKNIGFDHLLSAVCSREELYAAGKLLVKLLVVQASGYFRVYVFAHHAVWDNESTSIFTSRLKHYFTNKDAKVAEHNYFKDISIMGAHSYDKPELIDEFLFVCDSLRDVIQEDNSSVVFWGKRLTEEEESAYVKNRVEYILSTLQSGWCYREGKSSEDISCIPILFNHNGRKDENRMTLGLYLDVIPVIYDRKEPFAVYDRIQEIIDADFKNGNLHNYLLSYDPEYHYFAVDLNMVEVFEADEENMVINEPMFAENTGEAGLSAETLYGKGYINLQMSFNPAKRKEIEKLVFGT